jgi:hypothetical protein
VYGTFEENYNLKVSFLLLFRDVFYKKLFWSLEIVSCLTQDLGYQST